MSVKKLIEMDPDEVLKWDVELLLCIQQVGGYD